MKKVILSCLKMNLKIYHNLRQTDVCKGIFKIDARQKATVELVKSSF